MISSILSPLSTLLHALFFFLAFQRATSADSDEELHSKQFGHAMREKFLLNYTNFNHGSFGACPKRVLEYQASLRIQQDQQPDTWMRKRYMQLVDATQQEIAEYVHAPTTASFCHGPTVSSTSNFGCDAEQDETTLVLLQSASTAVNSILRSMEWQPGDIILYFDIAYGMVKNTAAWLEQTKGVEIVVVPVEFPIISNDADASTIFLRPLEQTLMQLKEDSKIDKLKVANIDHISSAPAIKEPVSECAHMIKQYTNDRCFVLVDGAHAMGQVRSLDLTPEKIGPIDAYLSNGHKWLYSPKGSAFLWVNPTAISKVFPEPTVISSSNLIQEPTSFVNRYLYVSTLDYTAPISMSEALKFRQSIGGDYAIYQYCRTLALQAKKHLLKLWNTTSIVPDSMEEFMIHIPIPIDNHADPEKYGTELMEYLLEKHNMYVIIIYHRDSGILYTRLSVQIYLELDDFVKLGDLVIQWVNQKKLTQSA